MLSQKYPFVLFPPGQRGLTVRWIFSKHFYLSLKKLKKNETKEEKQGREKHACSQPSPPLQLVVFNLEPGTRIVSESCHLPSLRVRVATG